MSPLGPKIILACLLAWGAHRLLRGEKQQGAYLFLVLLLSALLIGSWQPMGLAATLALAGLAGGAVAAVRRAPAGARRWIVNGTVILFVGVLVLFKSASRAGELFHSSALTGLAALAPLGLSYTVLRLIGVVIDASVLRIDVPFRQVLLQALFFPTFRAGPITTLTSLRLQDAADAEGMGTLAALSRIFFGLCRKLILAEMIQSIILTPWLGQGVRSFTPVQCFLLPVFHGLYLYWDFSGYTDIAIGTAALMGFRVPENFDRPYLSRNLVEFWRRWHVTLSEWIRMRLFMKMTGRRPQKHQVYLATLASMAICGLWHGVGMSYLVWGLWHGFGLVAVHLYQEARRRNERLARWGDSPVATPLSVLLTFTYVSCSWAFFFHTTRDAVYILGQGALGILQGLPVAAGLLGLLAAGYYGCEARESLARGWGRTPAVLRGLVYALLIFGIVIGSAGSSNFVYFQF